MSLTNRCAALFAVISSSLDWFAPFCDLVSVSTITTTGTKVLMDAGRIDTGQAREVLMRGVAGGS